MRRNLQPMLSLPADASYAIMRIPWFPLVECLGDRQPRVEWPASTFWPEAMAPIAISLGLKPFGVYQSACL